MMMPVRRLASLTVLAVCLVPAALGLATPNGISTKRKFVNAGQRGSVVLIDVENVRGASGFQLTHADVISSSSIWAKAYGLGDRVSLIVDHGSAPSGYYLKEKELSIIFAGKQMKADDVIVRDLPFCQRKLMSDVIVVTGDTELIQRCKRAADRSGGKEFICVKPIFFLQDLETVVGDILACEDKTEIKYEPTSEPTLDKFTSEMEAEIKLGARLIAVETQLRTRGKSKKISPKKRKKLAIQARKIRTKLGLSGPSSLDKVTSLIVNGNVLDSTQQAQLLAKWESIRKSSGRKEMTGDRVLLAESLRRQLESITMPNVAHTLDLDLESMNPAEAHASYANSLIFDSPYEKKDQMIELLTQRGQVDLDDKETLRIVVVSDTHGCERSFNVDLASEPWLFTKDSEDHDSSHQPLISTDERTYKNQNLPGGDILLHLGDFAIDRGGVARRNALVRFDDWLSNQPHQVKIVLRGNHDPYQADFIKSKARYVTEPTTITIANKVIACIPYGQSGFSTSNTRRSSSLLPSTCDVLATHEPPYNILDKCLSGQKAGSSVIRTAVENMKGLPPKLWVCGHIHEGRGVIRTCFGTTSKRHKRETVIINASNANDGRASHLVHGPVVIDISDEDDISDGMNEPIARARRHLSPKRRDKRDGEQELLLAIDLGLRCGASLFDDSGKLHRYEQLRFSDGEELYQRAPELIESWTSEINSKIMIDAGNTNKKYVLSYLAIEGGGELFDAWESSLDNEGKKDIQLVSVRPEEWRAHLLSQKERQSGRSCKEAARLIARQIVSDYGAMGAHEGKFKTDAAESVAMGFYMASHLGWVSRNPLISRYSNGKVIVPR